MANTNPSPLDAHGIQLITELAKEAGAGGVTNISIGGSLGAGLPSAVPVGWDRKDQEYRSVKSLVEEYRQAPARRRGVARAERPAARPCKCRQACQHAGRAASAEAGVSFLEYHPLANLFPLIEGASYSQLVDDVRLHGVRDPVVLLGGKILDGRNRYRAGLEAGFFQPSPEGSPIPHPQYMFDHFEAIGKGTDPLAWVVSKNLQRRHLTDDQRRMVAARIANLSGGRPAKTSSNGGGFSNAAAANLLAVDETGVERAKVVVTRGALELQHAVDQRRVTVRMAADLAALPQDQQREIISLTAPHAIRDAVRDVRRNLRTAIGTNSASKAERGDDLYETPAEAVHVLLALEDFSPTIWEPACGKGAISKILEAAGYDVVLSDLVDRGCADSSGVVQHVGDFLESRSAPDFRADSCPDIVTNPPYGALNAFVAHALRLHRPKKMALLLNLNFLCGSENADRKFARDENRPSRIHVFTRRLPMMHRDGWDGPEASSSMNTAWFVWERDEAGNYGTQRVVECWDWRDFQPKDEGKVA